MKVKIVVAVIMILSFLILSVNANTVVTDSITFDIVAGDSIDINFTVNSSESKDTTCYVSISILPDSVGINLTYAPTFIMKPHTTTLYCIHVDTSLLLSPGNYNLTTTFQTEGTEPIVVHRHTHSSQGSSTPTPPINETEPPIDDTEENETIPPVTIPPKSTEGNQFDYGWILIIIITSIILLFLYLKKRRNKS